MKARKLIFFIILTIVLLFVGLVYVGDKFEFLAPIVNSEIFTKICTKVLAIVSSIKHSEKPYLILAIICFVIFSLTFFCVFDNKISKYDDAKVDVVIIDKWGAR